MVHKGKNYYIIFYRKNDSSIDNGSYTVFKKETVTFRFYFNQNIGTTFFVSNIFWAPD